MHFPSPWLHEFGVTRLEAFLADQESELPTEVLCPRCRLYRHRALRSCPSDCDPGMYHIGSSPTAPSNSPSI